MNKWIKDQILLMKRLTAFEICAGIASIVGLTFAIISEIRTQGYPNTVRVGRDIAIAAFLNLAIISLYARYNRLRLSVAKTVNHSNLIVQGSHDISHAYRDVTCKLEAVAEKHSNDMDDFANAIETDIRNKFSDNIEDRVNAVFDVLDGEMEKQEVILTFPDMDTFVDRAIEKRENARDKMRSKILSTTKDYFAKILLLAKHQFQHSLELAGIENESVSLTIKQLIELPKRGTVATGKLDDMEVFTCFRDPNSFVTNKDRGVGKIFHVGKNTAFKICFMGGDRAHWVFVKNNLKKSYDEGDYENERADFYKFYNSTVVVPIQDDKGTNATIYGFLAVDCPNRGGNDIFTYDPHVHLLANVADQIAAYWKVLDSYFPNIFGDYYDLKFSESK